MMRTTQKLQFIRRSVVALGLLLVLSSQTAMAAGSSQTPQSGSVGLEGTIGAPAPTQAATIVSPSNGQTFTTTPTTIAGLCKTGLLVKIFSNNIFIGSVQCANNSFTLQVSLFSGQNDLVARVYDALDQAGPDSNVVTVTFNDAQFAQFGTRVALTSNYAKLGANPGSELDWPIILSGGLGPYAISTDWGDGTSPTLQSQAFTGTFTIKHTYATAGIYNVVVRATDANGTTAFLQLVGVANGKVTQATTASGSTSGSNPGSANGNSGISPDAAAATILAMIPLIIIGFWLGRRHELHSIRKHLEESRHNVQ